MESDDSDRHRLQAAVYHVNKEPLQNSFTSQKRNLAGIDGAGWLKSPPSHGRTNVYASEPSDYMDSSNENLLRSLDVLLWKDDVCGGRMLRWGFF